MPEPKQARSRETQGRIVAAALELVAERGREGPSVPEIAKRAGVSIGAFYGRFPTKEALFEHVDRQLFEESARCWVAFLAPENWRGRHAAEIVREVVRGWVDAVANHHPLNRALTERWRSAPPTPAVRAAATAHYEAIFDALGDAARGATGRGEPSRSAARGEDADRGDRRRARRAADLQRHVPRAAQAVPRRPRRRADRARKPATWGWPWPARGRQPSRGRRSACRRSTADRGRLALVRRPELLEPRRPVGLAAREVRLERVEMRMPPCAVARDRCRAEGRDGRGRGAFRRRRAAARSARRCPARRGTSSRARARGQARARGLVRPSAGRRRLPSTRAGSGRRRAGPARRRSRASDRAARAPSTPTRPPPARSRTAVSNRTPARSPSALSVPSVTTSSPQFGFQCVQPVRPEPPDPVVELREAPAVERVKAARAVRPRADHTVLAQHAEVLRHARPRDRERGRDLAGRAFAFGDELDDASPRRIRQSLECAHGERVTKRLRNCQVTFSRLGACRA